MRPIRCTFAVPNLMMWVCRSRQNGRGQTLSSSVLALAVIMSTSWSNGTSNDRTAFPFLHACLRTTQDIDCSMQHAEFCASFFFNYGQYLLPSFFFFMVSNLHKIFNILQEVLLERRLTFRLVFATAAMYLQLLLARGQGKQIYCLRLSSHNLFLRDELNTRFLLKKVTTAKCCSTVYVRRDLAREPPHTRTMCVHTRSR